MKEIQLSRTLDFSPHLLSLFCHYSIPFLLTHTAQFGSQMGLTYVLFWQVASNFLFVTWHISTKYLDIAKPPKFIGTSTMKCFGFIYILWFSIIKCLMISRFHIILSCNLIGRAIWYPTLVLSWNLLFVTSFFKQD